LHLPRRVDKMTDDATILFNMRQALLLHETPNLEACSAQMAKGLGLQNALIYAKRASSYTRERPAPFLAQFCGSEHGVEAPRQTLVVILGRNAGNICSAKHDEQLPQATQLTAACLLRRRESHALTQAKTSFLLLHHHCPLQTRLTLFRLSLRRRRHKT
jgi:hypothetical protein